jgi:hypothetical protein
MSVAIGVATILTLVLILILNIAAPTQESIKIGVQRVLGHIRSELTVELDRSPEGEVLQ